MTIKNRQWSEIVKELKENIDGLCKDQLKDFEFFYKKFAANPITESSWQPITDEAMEIMRFYDRSEEERKRTIYGLFFLINKLMLLEFEQMKE